MKRYVKSTENPIYYETESLMDFSPDQLKELIKLLQAWVHGGIPSNFERGRTFPICDLVENVVYLCNDANQLLKVNKSGNLELWISTPNGHEGFLDDLAEKYRRLPNYFDEVDIKYLRNFGAEI